MKARYLSLLLLLAMLSLPLRAEGADEAWMSAFEEAWVSIESDGSTAGPPTGMALALAARVGKAAFSTLDAPLAARLSFTLAVAIDTDLRKGLAYQEAMARSIQSARLLAKDLATGGDGAVRRLLGVRARTGWLLGRARASELADPLGKGGAGAGPGWMGMR